MSLYKSLRTTIHLLKSIEPFFLTKLDTYLLIRYPIIWSLKLHYGIIFVLLTALLLFLNTLIPLNLADPYTGFRNDEFIIQAPAVLFIPVVLWIALSIQYNSFDQPHMSKPGAVRYALIGSWLLFLLVAVITILYDYRMNARIAKTISKEQLVNDILILNRGDALLFISPEEIQPTHSDSNHTYWKHDNRLLYFPFPLLPSPGNLNYANEREHQQLKIIIINYLQKASDTDIRQLILLYLNTLAKYNATFQLQLTTESYKNELINQIFYAYKQRKIKNINSFDLLLESERLAVRTKIESIHSAQYNFENMYNYKISFIFFLFLISYYIALVYVMYLLLGWKRFFIYTYLQFLLLGVLLLIAISFIFLVLGRSLSTENIMFLSIYIVFLLLVYLLFNPIFIFKAVNIEIQFMAMVLLNYGIPALPMIIMFNLNVGLSNSSIFLPVGIGLGILLSLSVQPVIQKRMLAIRYLPNN
jgi:hypothetical protein